MHKRPRDVWVLPCAVASARNQTVGRTLRSKFFFSLIALRRSSIEPICNAIPRRLCASERRRNDLITFCVASKKKKRHFIVCALKSFPWRQVTRLSPPSKPLRSGIIASGKAKRIRASHSSAESTRRCQMQPRTADSQAGAKRQASDCAFFYSTMRQIGTIEII